MRGFLLHVLNLVCFVLPVSRFYKTKSFLYRVLGRCRISKTARMQSIRISGVNVEVGDDTFIGQDTIFIGGCDSWVKIGKNCDISSRVMLVTGSHVMSPDSDRMAGDGFSKDIEIGNGVWVGCGVTIIGGVTVGSMAMVGAGAVVVNDVPPYTVVAGNPARPIKKYDCENQEWVKL